MKTRLTTLEALDDTIVDVQYGEKIVMVGHPAHEISWETWYALVRVFGGALVNPYNAEFMQVWDGRRVYNALRRSITGRYAGSPYAGPR